MNGRLALTLRFLLALMLLLPAAVPGAAPPAQAAQPAPGARLATAATGAGPHQSWRLGINSPDGNAYADLAGRLAGPLAVFDSTGSPDQYFIFPAPARSVAVDRAAFNLIGRTGVYSGTASLALEVYDFSGAWVQTVSAETIDLQTTPTMTWQTLALVPLPAGRLVEAGQFLAFRFSLDGAPGYDLGVQAAFDVHASGDYALAAPGLVSPADGALVATSAPALSWDAVSGAAGYFLTLDGVLQDVGAVTQFTPAGLPEGAHTWQVSAYDGLGNRGPGSTTWSLTVDTLPPAAPALVSPADGGWVTTLPVTLTWTISPEAAGYLLTVDGVENDVGAVAEFGLGPASEGAHAWQVKAYDAAGNPSPPSDLWSFTVDTQVPAAPVLISPPDGSLVASTTVTLTWQTVGDAAGYRLTLDGSTVDVGLVREYVTATLSEGAHTWKVATYDAAGNQGLASAEWAFTVDTQAPAAPTLISPPDGSLLASTTVTLTWQPLGSAAGYRLSLDGVVIDAGMVTEYAAGPLTEGPHTWQVAGYDAASSDGPYSALWDFTIDTLAPAAPVLISPPDGSLVASTTVTLTWQGAAGSAGYLLTLDGVEVDAGAASEYAAVGLSEGAHTWKVAAYNSTGHQGAASAEWTFMVDTQAPAAPELISPPDGSTVYSSTLTLTWQPAAGAQGYHVELDGVRVDAGPTTRFETPILAEGNHTWQVVAYDAAGNLSPPSALWTFDLQLKRWLYLPAVFKP